MSTVVFNLLYALVSGILVTLGAMLLVKLWRPDRVALAMLRAGQVSGHSLRWNSRLARYESRKVINGPDLRRAFPM